MLHHLESTYVASKKKVTEAPDIDRGAVPNQQEVSPSELPLHLVKSATDWSQSTGEFNAEDLAAALGLDDEVAIALTRRLHDDQVLEHGKIVPSENPLHIRYRARLTTKPDPGEPDLLDPEKGQDWVYMETALAETSGPPVARSAFLAFAAIGQQAHVYRDKLRSELQRELDQFCDELDAGDGHLGSLEANQSFARALNSLLDDLGLRLKDPKTGSPATLRAYKAGRGPESGYFAFNVVGASSRGSYRRLPRLVLMDRPEYSLRTKK